LPKNGLNKARNQEIKVSFLPFQKNQLCKKHRTQNKPWNQGNQEPRNRGTLEKAATEAVGFDLNITPYKNGTFIFTIEELDAIEDLKIELKRRQDLPATKFDIVRCAIHSIVEDYRQRGADSFIVQSIRKKKAR
jgi:hypothetical protein